MPLSQAPTDGTDLNKLLRSLGISLPSWLAVVLLALVVAGALAGGLKLLPVTALWTRVSGRWARGRADQRLLRRRQGFANHVEGQMRLLGDKEEWRDEQYTELEAEIEVRRQRGPRWWRRDGEPDLRRVRSLSQALRAVPDKLVVLEGEPGSGKSVALRHLTETLALEVYRTPTATAPIPLYVNLKELAVTGEVTAADIRAHVFAAVNRTRNSAIDRYLDDEFDTGLAEGTWLFLFDSFDEIPAILGATEAGPVIERYSDALHDFLHGMNACRGIVASREFRGPPRRASWPKFRIVPLSWQRKADLVARADLRPAQEIDLLDDLRAAPAEIQAMSDNPMFLGLLCEHIREGREFPSNAHVVIESYVQARFDRDAHRIRDVFTVEPAFVRRVAEELAFRIADGTAPGLTVPRPTALALLADRFPDPDELTAALDALEYTKLARSADGADGTDGAATTFAHRRLQEYFATCVVLREPDRVSPDTLVTDGHWRETAVTVLQTQTAAHSLYEAAHRALLDIFIQHGKAGSFEWLPGEHHVLRVLAEGGGSSRYTDAHLVDVVDGLLDQAWRTEAVRDRKWVLEVCAAASPRSAARYVAEAFRSTSSWLRDEAFTQARNIRVVSGEIEREMRQTLIDFAADGRLLRHRRSIRSQVMRVADPVPLLRSLRLLLWAFVIDLAIGSAAVWLVAERAGAGAEAFYTAGLWAFSAAVMVIGAGRPGRYLVTVPGGVVMRTAIWLSALGTGGPLAGGVVALGLLWIPGVMLGVRRGVRLEPWRWPLLLALAASHVAPAAVRNARDLIPLVTIIAVLSGVVLAVQLFLGEVAITVLTAVMTLILGAAAMSLVTHWLLDLRTIRTAHTAIGSTREVTPEWLAATLAALHTSAGVRKLVKDLRTAEPAITWQPSALDLLVAVARGDYRRLPGIGFGVLKVSSGPVQDEIARIHDEQTSAALR